MLRAVAQVATANLLIQGLTLLTSPLLARALGPHGRGELAIVMTWPAIMAGLVTAGIDVELSRRVAKRRNSSRSLRRLALVAAATIGFVASGAGVLAAAELLPPDKGYLVPDAQVAFLYIPASVFTVYGTALALGQQRFRAYNIIRAAFSLLYLGSLVVLAVMHVATVRHVVLAFTGAAVVTSVVAWLGASGPPTDPTSHETIRLMDFLGGAAPFAASTASSVLTVQALPILLVFLAEPHDIGLFSVALAGANAHTALGNAVAKVLFARFSSLTQDNAAQWLRSHARRATAACLALCIATLLAAPPLIPLVFGEAFSAASMILIVLVPASGAQSLAVILEEALKGSGVAWAGMTGRLVSTATLIVGALLLHPLWGNRGIAAAACIGAGLQLAVLTRATMHQYAVGRKELLGVRLADFVELYRIGMSILRTKQVAP